MDVNCYQFFAVTRRCGAATGDVDGDDVGGAADEAPTQFTRLSDRPAR
ncbi:hypothetical protein [Gordonia shandongensis]|nr:hypothetical protein [Gordonia shandongensis]